MLIIRLKKEVINMYPIIRKSPANMKYKFIIYGFLIYLMIMTSCRVYYPQISDIPLINERKDLRLDAGISIVPSAHATISYGLTDKIAVQAFGSTGLDGRYYFQGAAGLFKPNRNQKVMEFYCGFGYGYGITDEPSLIGELYGDYQLYFIQSNYGKIDSKFLFFSNMDFGFGLKTGYLHSNLTHYNYHNFTTYRDHSLLIEPNVFFRLGYGKLKLNLKLGGCWINKFTNNDKSLPYNSIINSVLSLNYRL
jgi:hypothetical protein